MALLVVLTACSSGGGDGGGTPATPAPPAPAPNPERVSTASPFAAGCGGPATGTLYANAEVEPHLAINPANAANLIATWQQDRWSNGGAQGTVSASTINGGITWTVRAIPASRCAGGTAANGGDFERATDPWVAFSPNGVAYQMSLAITGASFAAGSESAMLVFRSADGGQTWGSPAILIRDGESAFNDKNTITADPADARFVYAVWDRLTSDNRGPAMFARTIDSGATWEPAKVIYDPGVNAQTIGNVIAVLPDGTLVNLFTKLRFSGGATRGEQTVIRSTDRGTSWSVPIKVADFLGIGTRDPETGQAIRDGGFLPQIAVGAQGQLHAVWQDARFSGGQRDAIVMVSSNDGGLTWGAVTRVSPDNGAQALIGTVNARADGLIGVSYYDLRNNTADATTLLADHWLATSRDLVNWTDRRVTPASFDYAVAPVARGLFLGDYMGLASSGASFFPLHVRTTSDLANRTDVFFTPVQISATAQADSPRHVPQAAREVTADAVSAEFRRQVSQNIERYLDARRPDWARRAGMASPP